ncbi:hypothetical protein [Clostridium septicum]|nr:hypothetical protein [Clostridium septicum]MDU1313657.1 hypothetical protein [Clostridium septicum]WLF70403.1 hypothetical protein Q6375_05280 [Clostridium septicum]
MDTILAIKVNFLLLLAISTAKLKFILDMSKKIVSFPYIISKELF